MINSTFRIVEMKNIRHECAYFSMNIIFTIFIIRISFLSEMEF